MAFHFIVQFGYFSFGGSTVICVFEKVKYVWLLNLQYMFFWWTLSFSFLDYHEYTHGARKMCAEVLLVHIYKLDVFF